MSERYATVRYLCGATAARTGDEASGPALLLLGVAVTGSAATGSALLAGVTATAAIGGPLVGVALDRSRRPGRLLAILLVLYALGLVAVALLVGRLHVAPVVVLALIVGLPSPALSGGWTAQLPRVVSASRATGVSTWDAMTFGVASLVGPALAGAVALGFGALTSVVVAAALVALAVPAALALPDRKRPPERVPLLAELVSGARAVLGNRTLARVTAVSTISIAGTGAFVVATPVLGERTLGGAAQGALLLALMAVGSLAANLVTVRRPLRTRPETVVFVCVLVQCVGVMGAAVAPSALWLLFAVALVGAAEGPQLAALLAVRRREAPERLRSQVFTTAASVKVSAFALGAALAGPAADLSPALCSALAAAFQGAAALTHLLMRPRSGSRG
ncbi:MFS transporter [Nocardiopsis alba]|uniref:MFS transporter n=1 Tax=Nocardiopsis alba TaxID=53437 RepID=UPI00341169C5